ncbi:peptidylprolyl isomerase [Amycolatopsis sp. FBCC-B4732]|uniref:peptidylprolyl isomerase n=1 Tax=Amycolatopsis sp. FBCC-B4732 TaxID=3079339 RepID=UPI001FF279AC|nr:peptidylprolyl isomerase [Amycolatopsis sp. FBCC-B4732]UOX90694.1 peptidylprolyl isomerase [Amycolatopsis sp. FBCC-B4732]
MTDIELRFRESAVLDLFLALHRELKGRMPWEIGLVQNPPVADIARFRTALRALRGNGADTLPAWLATAHDIAELSGPSPAAPAAIAEPVGAALTAAAPVLMPVIDRWAGRRTAAAVEVARLLPFDRIEPLLRNALGVTDGPPLSLALHLVPYAPHSPGVGFLTEGGRPAAAYADCRRFSGSTLADCVLTLVCWALLTTSDGPATLTAELAARLPGATPYARRLRAVLIKLLVEYTAGHFVAAEEPTHRACVDVLGSAWRFPRLVAVVERHWGAFLAGRMSREEALSALAGEVASHRPQWYVDHVDGSSLAADFYLLEMMTAGGDREAGIRLARWVPRLAYYFARQLDLIIGLELGHYERAHTDPLPDPLVTFIRQVTSESSSVAWARVRAELGQVRALSLAADAFAGPGTEYGGRLWAPVATLLRAYVCHELSEAVFVDQCFTMEHNNGSLFDKFFLTEDMPAVLDAQAAGDVDVLLAHASAEVRCRWQGYARGKLRAADPAWAAGGAAVPLPAPSAAPLWTTCTITAGTPGALGCGSSATAEEIRGPGRRPDPRPVHVRDRVLRKPISLPLRRYVGVRATLLTNLGPVTMNLWPELAPYSVDNFVRLAEGTRRWKDPHTGRDGDGGFYDGTRFFRRVPGFLVQAGDRTETGQGGPGYRVPDEPDARRPFDRPFLVALSNLGPASSGSQFFVTLAPAEHLSGYFNQFGEIADDASRSVLASIAVAEQPPVVESVAVAVW